MNNEPNIQTRNVSYNNLKVGDRVWIPIKQEFFSVAMFIRGGGIALETGGEDLWRIAGCEKIIFWVHPD